MSIKYKSLDNFAILIMYSISFIKSNADTNN